MNCQYLDIIPGRNIESRENIWLESRKILMNTEDKWTTWNLSGLDYSKGKFQNWHFQF